MRRTPLNNTAAYGTTLLLCGVFLVFALPLTTADWNIPFEPFGDGLQNSLLIKTLRENPWYFSNPRLAAPGTLNWYDYPLIDSLHIAVLKLLSICTPSYGLALNVAALAGFFAAAITALAALRQLGVSYPLSVAGSLLYAFAPYHLMRFQGHLFLGFYYLVPLITLMLVGAYRAERPRLATVLLCILTGCAGVYYAFFAVLLLIGAALHTRRLRPFLTAAALSAVIALSIEANLLPVQLYSARHGKNSAIAARDPQEIETYGLRVNQLLLPIRGHRLTLFRNIRFLHPDPGSENEAYYSSLGLVAVSGFFLLCAIAIFGFPAASGPLAALSFLTLLSLLIGVTGGFGQVFAFFVSSQIRGYNRISIFIAFFSLAALGLILDRVLPQRKILLAVVAAAITILGILDQTAPAETLHWSTLQDHVRVVRTFVQRLERRLPPNAMILELPYMPFPESPKIGIMTDYEPVLPYLESSTLRWSYGATRGRIEDSWIRDLTTMKGNTLLAHAAVAGFAGIYVDLGGTPDPNLPLERMESSDHRIVFYDLRPHAAVLRQKFSAEEWEQVRQQVLHPATYRVEGCTGLETDVNTVWRWCGNKLQITFDQAGTLEADLLSPTPNAHLTVDRQSITIGDTPAHIARAVQSSLQITSDGPGLHLSQDPRPLVLRIQNFTFRPAGSRPIADPDLAPRAIPLN